MNTRTLAAAISIALLALPGLALADDDAGTDPTYNVDVTSDYIFRGITQTWGGPAIQGGVDYTFPDGRFAIGAWASSLSEKSFPGAAGELDLYASYGASFAEDWSWKVGAIAYLYPGGSLDEARPALPGRKFNTVEVNASLSWKWLTLKYNHALTDYFAVDTEQGYKDDSKGTHYFQVDATWPIAEQWSLALHAGHTDFSTELASPLSSGEDDPSYSDFGATVKWQFTPQWNVNLNATHATNDDFYGDTVSFRNPSDTKDVGGTRAFVMLQGNF